MPISSDSVYEAEQLTYAGFDLETAKQLLTYMSLQMQANSLQWWAAYQVDGFLQPHPEHLGTAYKSSGGMWHALHASANAILVVLLHAPPKLLGFKVDIAVGNSHDDFPFEGHVSFSIQPRS